MTQMTIVGNLVDPPEQLRYTSTGQAYIRMRIASTHRYQDKDTGQWKDGETLFMTCTAWRKVAEHVVESQFERGQRLIVVGKLRYREWESDGEKRNRYELEIDDVGPSVRNAVAKAARLQRHSEVAAEENPWASNASAARF